METQVDSVTLDTVDAGPNLIEVVTYVHRHTSSTVVEFIASTPKRGPLSITFELEGFPVLSDRAVTESALLATVALAMQQRCALKIHGRVSRSLRHSIDTYQSACAWWWPQRYQPTSIEVGVIDDEAPKNTRGVLCFSGGVDSIFSGHTLVRSSQIEAGLLLQGYDIDIDQIESLKHQRHRIDRLSTRLALEMIVIRTNVRKVLGQDVIEGAQGSYLAAALALLSDRFGRGFVSSGLLDLADIGDGDPVHEATMPLLGGSHFPLHVHGGPITRLDKLRVLSNHPELFSEIRVCLGRDTDMHCGRCSKCLLNAYACIAITGEWPSWLPSERLDPSGLVEIPETQKHRRRFAEQILALPIHDDRTSRWLDPLRRWIEYRPVERKEPFRRRVGAYLPPRLRRTIAKLMRLFSAPPAGASRS